MRKLLLGTTALAAAATLSANAALADVSISGYYEWKYQSTSADVTSQDGTTFGNDSEIKFGFTNKTDSGLDLGLTVEMLSDAGDTEIDEASLSISGGFGKIVLGQNDGVGDNYGVASTDLPAEEIYAGVGTDNDINRTLACADDVINHWSVMTIYPDREQGFVAPAKPFGFSPAQNQKGEIRQISQKFFFLLHSAPVLRE